MSDSGAGGDEIRRMQAGVRDWVRRAARRGEHGLRTASPAVLLSLICASAVSPVVAAGAGVTSAAAVAGAGVVSSVGGGVLSGVIASALDRLRARDGEAVPSREELEQGIAGQIQEMLAAGNADAHALRAEIAAVLEAVDAGGTALQAAIEEDSEQVRRDVIAMFGELGAGFTELRFLLTAVEQAAEQIQAGQDAQGAQLRVLIDKVAWAGTEARLAREEAAAWRAAHQAAPADGPDAGQRRRWARGCPYRGLLPFTEAEAEVFYGRERLIAELAGQIESRPGGAGLVIVTGASGAGKSSLLRAGLVPALARGLQIPGSQDWPRIVMTPTGQPMAELAAHLAALGGASAAAALDDLSSSPHNAHRAVRQALIAGTARQAARSAAGGGARLVLIVDQFEQVFTVNPGNSAEAERQAFITALCTAATCPAGPDGQPPALVILAVRGDYWDQCAAYPQLARALQENHFTVGPMTETELRLAITGPAEAAGLQIGSSLTDAILSDLRSIGSTTAAGTLPLLSQAMLLTWDNRDGTRLTSHGYSQAGGVRGAVQASADAVFSALSADQQSLARDVLAAMTAVGSDGRLTRRTVARADLHAGRPDADRSQIDAVMEAFAARRLLVLNDGTAEISHDVLLHAWPRLRGWLEEDQASLILHSQLADDAAIWRGHHGDPSFLYRGTQLAAIRQAAARWSADPGRYPALTGTQRDFLHAAVGAASRASRRRRLVTVVLAVLVIASLAGAGVAVGAARTARQQTALAVSGQAAVQSEALDTTDPVTASLLAAAAWHIDPGDPLATESLLDAYAQPERAVLNASSNDADVYGVAFCPDGTLLATSGNDATVRVWDVATHRQVGASITVGGSVPTLVLANGLAFSPDGRLLATGWSDARVRFWDVATHHQVGTPIIFPGSNDAGAEGVGLAFSPDGRLLAGEAANGAVRIWDVATHRQVGAPIIFPASRDSGGEGLGLAFSPDGRLLATPSGDGAVRIWDVATHRPVGAPITVHASTDGVNALTFSPDGALLATAGRDGAVRVWNVATHREIGVPMTAADSGGRGRGVALGVAFSPDGTLLATAGGDGTARLWDVATDRQAGTAITVPGGIYGSGVLGLAFSPDGTLLATADGDGTARLWDLAFRRQIGAPITIPGHSLTPVGIPAGVYGIAFSPDGRLLGTAGRDGTARLWDVASHRQIGAPITSPGSNDGVTGLAFSPGSKLLATAGSDGTIRFWDIASHRQVGATINAGIHDLVSELAFSPDGTLLAAEDGATVRFWDVATHRQVGAPIVVPSSNDTDVNGMAFSPDGAILATGGNDGTARLWDVATHRRIGAPIAVPDSNGSGVDEVTFSPDSRLLATADGDAMVRFWDVATHRQVGAPIAVPSGNGSGVNWIAFSPDGAILATAGSDGTARLWDVATHHQVGAPIAVPSGNGSGVDGVAFSTDSAILATAGSDDTVRLWDVALPGNLLNAVCAIAGRSITRQEWNADIQSEPFQQVCP